MDCLLHPLIEILNAHAETVESQPPQRFEVRAAGDARVHFDADFGVRREGKALASVAEKLFHLCGSEIRRRAAAPVKLGHGAFFGDHWSDVLNFALERGEIGGRDALVFLYGNVARAK